MQWNTCLSEELQQVVDSFKMEELYGLEFSVTIADPTQADCPLVGCSMGFTHLTGYRVDEIVGRNCRFLLNGVPLDLIRDETRINCRSFCESVGRGGQYDGCHQVLPPGVSKDEVCSGPHAVSTGELICVQTNAMKSGQLFRNMFLLKQVELDDAPYIIGLQAAFPEDMDDDEGAVQEMLTKCQDAFSILNGNMACMEQVLTSQFWYSAPMRRQM